MNNHSHLTSPHLTKSLVERTCDGSCVGCTGGDESVGLGKLALGRVIQILNVSNAVGATD